MDHGVTHKSDNIFVYTPDQKTLMLVDVIYPGWVLNIVTNNYDLDNFVGGHLTRLGIVDDIRLHQEFIQDLNATAKKG